MKGPWRRTLTAIALSLALTGCAHVLAYNAALDAERQGDLEVAAQKTVEAIEASREYPEARTLWERLWPKTRDEALQRIDKAEQNQDWETAISRLESLEGLVRRAAAQNLDAPSPPSAGRLQTDRVKAAEKHYQRALTDEQHGRGRDAATGFRQALRFVPGYLDAESRYAKNRAAAMVRVAVLPFENASYFQSAGDLLYDHVMQALMKHQGEFVAFVDRPHLASILRESSLQASGLGDPHTAVRLGQLAGVRYLVVGRVSQVSATTPVDTREPFSVSRPMAPTANSPATVVSASYTLWRLTREVVLTASLQAIDVGDGTVAHTWTESETETDTTETISNVSGDTRALDYHLQSRLYTTPTPKSHDALLSTAAARMAGTLAKSVAEFLN